MRKILSCAAMAAMVLLAWSADGATAVQKAPAKKTAAARKASPAKKTGVATTGKKGVSTTRKGAGTASSRQPGTTSKTASSRGRKTTATRGVTWRNRQTSPSPERYREIQGALDLAVALGRWRRLPVAPGDAARGRSLPAPRGSRLRGGRRHVEITPAADHLAGALLHRLHLCRAT